MPASIGGLASGLDTTALINAALETARTTRNQLTRRQSETAAEAKAWQDIAANLNQLTAATGKAGGNVRSATSSDSALVAVTANSTADRGTLTFTVGQLATSHQLLADGFAGRDATVGTGSATVHVGLEHLGLRYASGNLTDGSHQLEIAHINRTDATVIFNGRTQTVTANGTVTVEDNNGNTATYTITEPGLREGRATTTQITASATTTLAQLASAINNTASGITATVIDKEAGPNSHALTLTARDSGNANTITTDFAELAEMANKPFAQLRAGNDAKLILADGQTAITRPGNHITDLLAGVAIDLKDISGSEQVTVTVADDNAQAVTHMRQLVDALNSTVATLGRHNGAGGTLSGDQRARRIASQLAEAAVGDGKLARLGVTVSKTGGWTLNETKLRDTLAGTNPAATVGAAVAAVATAATAATSSIQQALATSRATQQTADRRIAEEDRRLAATETRLRQQYKRLETALAQLASQSASLAAALT